jgi:hypothetical protein
MSDDSNPPGRPLLSAGPPVAPEPPVTLPPPGNPKGSRYDAGSNRAPPETLPGNPKGSRYGGGFTAGGSSPVSIGAWAALVCVGGIAFGAWLSWLF